MEKTIVIFAPFVTHPSKSGPVTRLINSVDVLRSTGHKVFYAYFGLEGETTITMREYWGNQLKIFPYHHPSTSGNFAQRWRARFRKWLPEGNYSLKQNMTIDDWFDFSIREEWESFVDKINPDVVICHYVWLSKILEWLPESVTRIIDTHDRFSNRFKVAEAAGQLNDWYSTYFGEEKKGFRRADKVFSICLEDQEFFKNELKLDSVYYPPSIPLSKVEPPSGNQILFIGNRNAPNTQAMEWFIQNCWTQLRLSTPNISLMLIGNVCNTIPDTAGIEKMGIVDDLGPYYESCKLAINPVPSGSGLAIKCLEAFSYGRPVVATPAGARGLQLFEGNGLFICENPVEFSKTISELLESYENWSNLSRRCNERLDEWNHTSSNNLLDSIQVTSATGRAADQPDY
jgi:polysaccharide biosynthesis protein PslH